MTLCVGGGWVIGQEVPKTKVPKNTNNKNMLKTVIIWQFTTVAPADAIKEAQVPETLFTTTRRSKLLQSNTLMAVYY
jgi:hypothetical protein